MINFHAIAVIVTLSTLSHLGVAAADPLPTETFKVLPLTLVVEAAEAAITSCKAHGYSVTTAIVDRAGTKAQAGRNDGVVIKRPSRGNLARTMMA